MNYLGLCLHKQLFPSREFGAVSFALRASGCSDLRSFRLFCRMGGENFPRGEPGGGPFRATSCVLLLSVSDLGFVQLFSFNIPRNCFCRIIVASCFRAGPSTWANLWITVKD